MTYIRTLSESEATGELAELYRRLAYRDGTVDPAFQALSLHPALLSADAALYDTLMYRDSPLTRRERELLALTVSRVNGCERCLHHHATRLRALAEADGLASSERERALVAFAEKLTREPSAMGADDVERLRRAGLDDRAILDACNVVAYFNYANRVTLGLGIEVAPGGVDEWIREGP